MTKYNGYAAVAPHKPLERYDYQLPELGPNEVDIAVSHNGVCHTDIHMRVSPSNRGHDIEARLLINLPQPWPHAPSKQHQCAAAVQQGHT